MNYTLYIIIGVIGFLLIYLFLSYNSLVGAKNRVEEVFATMDVYLKKRWDLIPNLVENVKGYVKHEKETLTEIVNLRNKVYDKMTMDEKVSANKELGNGVVKLLALGESYPDLKASINFSNLSVQLSSVENDIANARKYYNAVVREYNNKVEMFPSNIVAKIFGFREEKMYEIGSEERNNITVKF